MMMNFNKVFEYSLKFFVSFSTIFYMTVPQGLAVENALTWGYMTQELFFRYGVMILFCLASLLKIKERIDDGKIFPVFVAYSIIIALSLGLHPEMRRQVLNVFIGYLFYKIVFENFEFSKLKSFGKWFIGVAVANLALMTFQWFRSDPLMTSVSPILSNHLDGIVGFMRLKVHLGLLAVLITPFLMFVNLWFAVLAIPLLFFSKSSVAIVAWLASTLLILRFRLNKWLFWSVCAGILALGAVYILNFDMPGGQFLERFKVWWFTFSYSLKSNVFFGNGLGSFAVLGVSTKQKTVSELLNWVWVHNEFLQAFFEAGLAGIVLIFVFVRERVEGFLKFRNDCQTQILFAAFLGLLLVSFFHFPFHLGRFAPLCVFVMALMGAKLKDLENVS